MSKTGGPPGSVRIIGGEWRGRRLPIPPGAPVRPTPDRIRETVFNWLGSGVVGSRCLDLFAGTGAFGFEALSRGAAEVVMVERDPVLFDALAAAAMLLGAGRAALIRGDARVLLGTTPGQGQRRVSGRSHRELPAGRFHLIVLDPPFGDAVDPLLGAVATRLESGGMVYIERPKADGLPSLDGLRWHRRGRAGAVEFGLATPD